VIGATSNRNRRKQAGSRGARSREPRLDDLSRAVAQGVRLGGRELGPSRHDAGFSGLLRVGLHLHLGAVVPCRDAPGLRRADDAVLQLHVVVGQPAY
jgi:hypothetical protein